MSNTDTENIEIWKIKNLIKNLSKAKGSGTSMVSLMIRAGAQISLTNQMLTEEYGTASNIKSRVNRQSVQSAIISTQQKLKTYSKTPKNGLVILCGTLITDDGKEKVCYDFEPFKELNKSLYLCDNKFHLEPLEELLINNDTYGFIIIDGSGLLLANVNGNSKNILHQSTVDLPKKHGRGGQSALRFARQRLEARHNYLTKSNELVKKYFTKDNKPIVNGIILAGSADLKIKLSEADTFPYILKPKILGILDISYGGLNGLNQTIELSKEILSSVKLMNEKKIVNEYFDNISKDTGKYCFGIKDSMYALEMGAVEKLLIYEDLETKRYILEDDSANGKVVFFDPKKDGDKIFYDKNKNIPLSIKSESLFMEWIMENYSKYGVGDLCLVSDKSQEGHQFCIGFGIGCILRWQLNFTMMEEEDSDNFDDFM